MLMPHRLEMIERHVLADDFDVAQLCHDARYSPTQRYAGEIPLAKSGVGAVVSRR